MPSIEEAEPGDSGLGSPISGDEVVEVVKKLLGGETIRGALWSRRANHEVPTFLVKIVLKIAQSTTTLGYSELQLESRHYCMYSCLSSNKMPSKPSAKGAQANNPEAASKAAIDQAMLLTFRDIVKEVIREENENLRGEIKEEITKAVSPIQADVDKFTKKFGDYEEGLENLDKRLEVVETCYADLNNQYHKLLAKTDDLENRGRRCNLRILGIPEGMEQGNPTRFIADLLFNILGGPDGLEKAPLLDRAHRVAAPVPPKGKRSQAFIVRIHYYQEKERIQQLARRKGKLEFRGEQIIIFPDYSIDLSRHGVRYGLIYPAHFRISMNGETKMFDSPESAKTFIESKFVQSLSHQTRESCFSWSESPSGAFG
uniref:L1 transposable element RRM domain-containing protein n=1 Tax=Xiphophorus couchianus TaxID=32473 RepID=A0A3B5M020_9TELE